MILSAEEIKKNISNGILSIEDFDEKRLGPNSYNLRLGSKILIYRNGILDSKKDNPTDEITIPDEGLIIYPGNLYLGETMEYTNTNNNIVPVLEGRSSTGRLGISIHSTAGIGDIGFSGRWTLEISCIKPVKIYVGMEICQILYHVAYGKIAKTYRGKYQNATGVQSSQLWKDFKEG